LRVLFVFLLRVAVFVGFVGGGGDCCLVLVWGGGGGGRERYTYTCMSAR